MLLKLLFFHFFRSLSDRVLKVSLLYCNFFSHFQNCKALVSRCSVASAIDFSSFATIFCSIYYKICYKLQKDKMAIALATEHLETNALQFWKWDKKWQYKSDTFITLSDTFKDALISKIDGFFFKKFRNKFRSITILQQICRNKIFSVK